jgi:hypothetical protein
MCTAWSKSFCSRFRKQFHPKELPIYYWACQLGKDNVWINLEIWTRKSWFCINHKLASCLVHNCYVAFYDCTKNYYYTYIYNNILLQKLSMTACFIQEESSGGGNMWLYICVYICHWALFMFRKPKLTGIYRLYKY